MIITLLITLLITNYRDLIPILFITSLSSDLFVAFPGVGFNRIILLVIMAGIIFERRLNGSVNKLLLLNAIAIMIMTFISFSFSNYKSYDSIISMVLNLLMLVVFSTSTFSKNDIGQIFKSIVFYSIMLSLLFIVIFISDSTFLSNGRLTISDSVNENRFGMLIAQVSVAIFSFILVNKKLIKRFFILILFLLNIYFILLSGSRTALLALILGTITISLIFNFKITNVTSKKIFKNIIIVSFVVGITYYMITSNQWLRVRFSIDNVVSSGGTNRWEAIINTIKYVIPNNLLIGIGISPTNEMIALSPYMSKPSSAHNIIVSMISQIGILGALTYSMLFFLVTVRAIKMVKINMEIILPLSLLITSFYNGIGEVMYSDRILWIALVLTIIFMNKKDVNRYEV
jgi:hypothetical protein